MGSLESLRELNRLRVVDALRQRGSASRAELARVTGLSRTTVTTLVADLQSRGLLVEDDAVELNGRGRPPTLLRLNASAGAALGVDFGHQHIRVAVADMSSTVLAERSIGLDVDADAATALDAAASMTEEVLAEAGVELGQLVGAGMGVPGPLDRRTGTIGSTIILPGWTGLNAAEELARRLGLRVEVDNDANLGALAEASRGAAQAIPDVVYVKLATGVGAGLVLGGRLHHGATGIAGELGHIQVQPGGAVCRCGNRGCLQSVASVPAVLASLRPEHGDEITLGGLLDLIEGGDLGARRVVNDAGRTVGRLLADLCNHLNPGAIVVGGDLSAAGEPLLSGIREAIDRYALPNAAEAVEVKAGVLGERAGVLGALALVIGDTDRLRSAGLAALHEPPLTLSSS
ncbi:MAG: ROK family protein [Gaiellaceae bacterium]